MITEREKAIYAMPSDTFEQRQAQVRALAELAADPSDEYDAHHGTDRSYESLEHLAATDTARFERVMQKIEGSR